MTPKRNAEGDEAAFAALVDLSAPPPTDVHDASTTVAEVPPSFLESLKSPSDAAPRVSALPGERTSDPVVEIVDLIDVPLSGIEPETLSLDASLLDGLTPAPGSPAALEPPQTVEVHVIAHGAEGTLAHVERGIAELPRPWIIAGGLVASVALAAVAFALVWTLASLL